jgi:hypothetical protein
MPRESGGAGEDPRFPPETAISRDGHSVTEGTIDSLLIAAVFEESVVVPKTFSTDMFLAGHSVTAGANESPFIAAVFEEDVVVPAASETLSSFGNPAPSMVDFSKSGEVTTEAAAA